MISRSQLLSSIAASAMLASVAYAQSTDVIDPAASVPCTIEAIFAKYESAAKREADAWRDRKEQELADPENRAARAKNRTEAGDENSWEGGSSHHRVAMHVPKIRMHRVSFGIPETFMAETRTQIPDGAEQCWVHGPFGWKTLVPCGVHYRDIVITVPQFRMKTVSLDLPDAVEWQRVDFSYDTPTVTVRDNRRELNTADGNIKRIKKELEDGAKAIADRNSAAFFEEADRAIEKVQQSVLADFDKQSEERLALFVKARSELETQRNAARANAGDRAGEVDAAFAKVATPIAQAEAAARAHVEAERKSVIQKFTELREDVKKSRLACIKQ